MTATRFAPSPTGEPHIGNIRTAIFAWAFARSQNGMFYIRIEDTDKNREQEGAFEKIMSSLTWLGLNYDAWKDPLISLQMKNHGIVFQSERLKLYQKYAFILLENGHAYVCTCSKERLHILKEEQVKKGMPPSYDGRCRNKKSRTWHEGCDVVRMKMPKRGKTSFTDSIYGNVVFENKIIDDQVLLKSDGYPTYHLANVVDDHEMNITHVIRGEDWLPSTPKHIFLYCAFQWVIPHFAHVPMILGKDKSKLSKRHGALSVLEYKREGFLPEALFNYLVLLGWSPGGDQEFMSTDEIVQKFRLEKVQKSPAMFNDEKLRWMNGRYIRMLKNSELIERLKVYRNEYEKNVQAENLFTDSVVSLVKERMETLGDFSQLTSFITTLPVYDASLLVFKGAPKEKTLAFLHDALGIIEQIPEEKFHMTHIRSVFDAYVKEQAINPGDLLHPMRIALTGLKNSPPAFETAEALKKEICIQRLKHAIALL